MSTVVAITPPEINAAAVGEFTRIAVLLSLFLLVWQRNYAGSWHVIIGAFCFDVVLTLFGGKLLPVDYVCFASGNTEKVNAIGAPSERISSDICSIELRALRTIRRTRSAARIFVRQPPRKGNNLHGRHPNFSRFQVETSGANPEEPSTARTVCDDRLSCSIRRTYTANQS